MQAHLLRQPEIDVSLPHMALERSAEILPDTIVVVDADVLVVVPGHQVGRVTTHCTGADGLDLNQVPGRVGRQPPWIVGLVRGHPAVLAPPDEQRVVDEGDLLVLPDVIDAYVNADTLSRCGLEDVAGKPLADQALPGAPELTGLAHPALPLLLHRVALIEDGLEHEAEGLV
jgi:hypothetical protein